MPRVLAAVLLLQLLAQASGLVLAAGEAACEASPDAQGDGGCERECEECLCCPQHRTVIPPAAALPAPAPAHRAPLPAPSKPFADPDPAEILHVPRVPALA